MTIREIQKKGYATAKSKGWYDRDLSFFRPGDVETILAKLALVGTEVSEAVEEVRTGDNILKFASELADIVIRTLDLAEAIGVDMDVAIADKQAKNELREYRHGGKRA